MTADRPDPELFAGVVSQEAAVAALRAAGIYRGCDLLGRPNQKVYRTKVVR